MHLRLALEAFSLGEFRALSLYGLDLLLLVANLVVNRTRADSVLDVLLGAIDYATMVPVVVTVASIRCITRSRSGVLGAVILQASSLSDGCAGHTRSHT